LISPTSLDLLSLWIIAPLRGIATSWGSFLISKLGGALIIIDANSVNFPLRFVGLSALLI